MMMTIDQLKCLFDASGLSMRQLAKEVGVNVSVISKMFAGKSKPLHETVLKIENILSPKPFEEYLDKARSKLNKKLLVGIKPESGEGKSFKK